MPTKLSDILATPGIIIGKSMEIIGNHRKSKENHGKSMGKSWKIIVKSMENPWKIHGHP